MRANLYFIALLLCFPVTTAEFYAAPLQPANISPANNQVNFSGNQISFTVTDPDAQPMTVKLYGRKNHPLAHRILLLLDYLIRSIILKNRRVAQVVFSDRQAMLFLKHKHNG